MSKGIAKAPQSQGSMKNLPIERRPREKMETFGVAALSNQELLALIIGSGSQGETALDLAQRLLAAGDEALLLKAEASELFEFRGIGPAKACQIKAAIEFGRRMSRLSIAARPVIHTPKEAADLLLNEMGYLDREMVRVLNLNTANQVIAVDTVSIGGLASAPVHPREVYKNPLKRGAAGIIILHNHPSGQLKPSDQDIQITKRLLEVGRLLGIGLYDHLILSGNHYLSMQEAGYFKIIEGEIS